jgi:hypothetical protein
VLVNLTDSTVTSITTLFKYPNARTNNADRGNKTFREFSNILHVLTGFEQCKYMKPGLPLRYLRFVGRRQETHGFDIDSEHLFECVYILTGFSIQRPFAAPIRVSLISDLGVGVHHTRNH